MDTIEKTLLINSSIDSLRFELKSDFKTIKPIIEKNFHKDTIFTNVSNDTVFTVFTTLIVFIIGIMINLIIKRIERANEKRKIRHFFKHHIDKLRDGYSVKLIKAYKELYQNMTIDSGITMNAPKVYSSDFERIKNIGSKELFFSVNNKTELSNILSQVDYFDKIIGDVDEYHKISLISNDKIRERIHTKINKYMEVLAEFTEYQRQEVPGYESNAHFIRVNSSIIHFYKNIAGKRALKQFYHQVLRPNQEYIVSSQLFRTHPKGKAIAEIGKDVSYDYNELRMLTIEFRLQYRVFANYLNESRQKMIENINKINWG